MAKHRQVPWNKAILEAFISEAMLTKEEEFIMRKRLMGWSRVQISMELDMSISNVDKIIARLKIKYDNATAFNPFLPPRDIAL